MVRPTEGVNDILQRLANGEISVEEASRRLHLKPYQDLEFARLDHHRYLRDGFPEVVFCPGKTHEQVAIILQSLGDRYGLALATRADREVFSAVVERVPEARYHEAARIISVGQPPPPEKGRVAVVTAGTADIGVAEEAAVTLAFMGIIVDRVYDVGVAGLHRLLDQIELINKASVVIVVAGMEGALASVVGGLTPRPVIAVPTSIGYGASFHGLAALLTMLNSCAPGVGVVNIDNGYGAACLAASILNCRR